MKIYHIENFQLYIKKDIMQLFQKLMLMKYLNINGLRFIKTCPKNKILLSNSKEQASFILKILIRHLKLQHSLQEIQISKY